MNISGNDNQTKKIDQIILGIEFGSTRIKAVLIDQNSSPIVSGSHEWENRYENEIWTYSLEDIWSGLQDCYRNLKKAYFEKFQKKLTSIDAIGFSGMMHGYMVFDEADQLLVPFRTWRNTTTGQAAEQLSEIFKFNIPQRWSIAHLYQAILNNEPHVGQIKFMTTLAGYIHWRLTGEKVLGIGEASGMFPIDSKLYDFDERMLKQFNTLVEKRNLPWTLKGILPKVLLAGDPAGVLTPEGAKLLDPEGDLKAGIPLCPPEGDAGTGMVATNSVAERSGNVSAGTSVFAMIVLEKSLTDVYPEIDMVTTPAGKPVAMVHANNCTSELNAWVDLFQEFSVCLGVNQDQGALFEMLFKKGLEGEADCGNLLSYNYFSGEPISHLSEGRPLFVRYPDSRFTLANFMRMHLYSALATLKIGLDILFHQEHVKIDKILGHGGFFKTQDVGQKIMAAAMNVPVSVMETAGEGGPWGMALLASYMLQIKGLPLETYLDQKVFAGSKGKTISPDPLDVKGFAAFMEQYIKGLPVEAAAINYLKLEK